MIGIPPSDVETELVDKLRVLAIEKGCVSVGDFYRELIKPNLSYRACVNTTFGADSCRFARVHPEVCTVLSNRFIVPPMPSTETAFKDNGELDEEWVTTFLEAVRSFMRCHRHGIPIAMVSQAFAPWKNRVQSIWTSWKGMFDDNPHLFTISAPSELTGRADLYIINEGDQAELFEQYKAENNKKSRNIHGRWDERDLRAHRDGSKPKARADEARESRRANHEGKRSLSRSDQAQNWRSNPSSRSNSTNTSPESNAPVPRHRSADGSPESNTSESPTKYDCHQVSHPIPVATPRVVNVLYVTNQQDAAIAVSNMRMHNQVAMKTFGLNETSRETTINALAITGRSRENPHLPVYVFNLQRLPFAATYLKNLLTDDRVSKVMHNGGRDCEVIASLFKLQLASYVDTAVLHHMLLSSRGEADGNAPEHTPSLNMLMSRYGLPQNHKPLTQPGSGTDFWPKAGSTRPIAEWCAREVAYILDLYDNLTRELNEVLKTSPMLSSSPSARATDDGVFANLASLTSATRRGEQFQYEITFIRRKPIRIRTNTVAEPAALSDESHIERLTTDMIPAPFSDCIVHVIKEVNLPVREISCDLGRVPVITFANNEVVSVEDAGEIATMQPLLAKIASATRGGADGDTSAERHNVFGSANRLGVNGTLHSVSCLRSIMGEIIGITFHVGMHYGGYTRLIEDVMSEITESTRSRAIAVLAGRETEHHRASLLREIAGGASSGDFKRRGCAHRFQQHLERRGRHAVLAHWRSTPRLSSFLE